MKWRLVAFFAALIVWAIVSPYVLDPLFPTPVSESSAWAIRQAKNLIEGLVSAGILYFLILRRRQT